jgi:L-ascorbate metabolism protein UlaG (beta-lactamase superfamily)
VRIVFDPYFSENPHRAVDPHTVRCDYILCSHAHDDHIHDALALARAHRAKIVASYELALHFERLGVATIDLMPGGCVDLPWGRIRMTPAIHSSSLELPDGTTRACGVACGFVVHAGRRAIYHAGDTALFSDMSLIGRHGLDVALIPIGDYYTMGPEDALEALRLLRPKLAVPTHYNTNEKIRQDPQAFAAVAATAGHSVRVMNAGDTLEL